MVAERCVTTFLRHDFIYGIPALNEKTIDGINRMITEIYVTCSEEVSCFLEHNKDDRRKRFLSLHEFACKIFDEDFIERCYYEGSYQEKLNENLGQNNYERAIQYFSYVMLKMGTSCSLNSFIRVSGELVETKSLFLNWISKVAIHEIASLFPESVPESLKRWKCMVAITLLKVGKILHKRYHLEKNGKNKKIGFLCLTDADINCVIQEDCDKIKYDLCEREHTEEDEGEHTEEDEGEHTEEDEGEYTKEDEGEYNEEGEGEYNEEGEGEYNEEGEGELNEEGEGEHNEEGEGEHNEEGEGEHNEEGDGEHNEESEGEYREESEGEYNEEGEEAYNEESDGESEENEEYEMTETTVWHCFKKIDPDVYNRYQCYVQSANLYDERVYHNRSHEGCKISSECVDNDYMNYRRKYFSNMSDVHEEYDGLRVFFGSDGVGKNIFAGINNDKEYKYLCNHHVGIHSGKSLGVIDSSYYNRDSDSEESDYDEDEEIHPEYELYCMCQNNELCSYHSESDENSSDENDTNDSDSDNQEQDQSVLHEPDNSDSEAENKNKETEVCPEVENDFSDQHEISTDESESDELSSSESESDFDSQTQHTEVDADNCESDANSAEDNHDYHYLNQNCSDNKECDACDSHSESEIELISGEEHGQNENKYQHKTDKRECIVINSEYAGSNDSDNKIGNDDDIQECSADESSSESGDESMVAYNTGSTEDAFVAINPDAVEIVYDSELHSHYLEEDKKDDPDKNENEEELKVDDVTQQTGDESSYIPETLINLVTFNWW